MLFLLFCSSVFSADVEVRTDSPPPTLGLGSPFSSAGNSPDRPYAAGEENNNGDDFLRRLSDQLAAIDDAQEKGELSLNDRDCLRKIIAALTDKFLIELKRTGVVGRRGN